MFGNGSWFIPAGPKFLCFSGSFLFRGERMAFLVDVSTRPVPHVLHGQGMGCHDKKGSLSTPHALVPGKIGVFSADLAQWVLVNLGQVHMK